MCVLVGCGLRCRGGEDGFDASAFVGGVVQVQLGEDGAEVGFDGAHADVRLAGDVVVGGAFGHEPPDVAFSFGEPVDRVVVYWERSTTAVVGVRLRMARAATMLSSVWLGGMRTSAMARSGRKAWS